MRYALLIRSINEVATCLEVGVEKLERGLLVHGAHADLAPLIANARSTEHDGRDMDSCTRSELAVIAETGRRLGSGSKHDQ